MSDTKTTPMLTIAEHSIPNGTKIVDFYGDGSGAKLFLVDKNGDLLDAEGASNNAPDTYLMDTGFVFWMRLPDRFNLWFEQREEEGPYTQVNKATLDAALEENKRLLSIIRNLMQNPSIDPADMVYTVREIEGLGWDGPNVKAWSDAVTAAKQATRR